MTLSDLLAALHRLLDDPRTTPNTPVRLQFETIDHQLGPTTDEEPLVAVALKDRTVILSTTAAEPAIAR